MEDFTCEPVFDRPEICRKLDKLDRITMGHARELGLDELVSLLKDDESSIFYDECTIRAAATTELLIYLGEQGVRFAVEELLLRRAPCWHLYNGKFDRVCPGHCQSAAFLSLLKNATWDWHPFMCNMCRRFTLERMSVEKWRLPSCASEILHDDGSDLDLLAKHVVRFYSKEDPLFVTHDCLNKKATEHLLRLDKIIPGVVKCHVGHGETAVCLEVRPVESRASSGDPVEDDFELVDRCKKRRNRFDLSTHGGRFDLFKRIQP